jgi:hypothetical protein
MGQLSLHENQRARNVLPQQQQRSEGGTAKINGAVYLGGVTRSTASLGGGESDHFINYFISISSRGERCSSPVAHGSHGKRGGGGGGGTHANCRLSFPPPRPPAPRPCCLKREYIHNTSEQDIPTLFQCDNGYLFHKPNNEILHHLQGLLLLKLELL